MVDLHDSEVEEVDEDDDEDDSSSSLSDSSVRSVISVVTSSRPFVSENSLSMLSSTSDLTLFSPSSIHVTALIRSERGFPPPLQESVDSFESGLILSKRFY